MPNRRMEMTSETIRTRRDPRREATRTALIVKAEALIAEFGVDGVSLRQIGVAIGSANNNAVAYHFGGKEELITAIYHYRLPGIEARRAELLAMADVMFARDKLLGLVDALWRPLYEQENEDGKHSYAAFLAGVARSGWAWTRYSLGENYHCVVAMIVERMRPLLPQTSQKHFHARLIATAAMMSNSLAATDGAAADSDAAFEDLIAMATAGLRADVGIQVK